MKKLLLWLAVVGSLSSASGDATGVLDPSMELHVETHLARRLFSLSSAFHSATSMATKAEQWVAAEGKKVVTGVGAALGMDKVLQILKDGQKFVSDGIAMAKAGWQAVKDMVSSLMLIFKDFKPLQPIFADKNGIYQLMTSAVNMRILVHTIQRLLGTSSIMQMLSDALQKTSAMFNQISTFFHSLLAKVTGQRRQLRASDEDGLDSEAWVAAERRLLDFTSLLAGLNFETIEASFGSFISQVAGFSTTLGSLNATFGPMLQQMDSMLAHGRRLGIQEDEQRYSAALKLVIPTWQGIEQLGITMCPVVLSAQDSASSLSCRVQGFIDKSGLSSVIPTVVSGCGAKVATSSAGSTCPVTSMSAGIEDMIGANSAILGWIIAACGAGAALLAGGAVGLSRIMTGKGGDGEEDEEEEEGEEDELVATEESRG